MRPFNFYPGPYPMNPYQMMPGGFSPFMRAPGFMPRLAMPSPMPTPGPMQALRAAIPNSGAGGPMQALRAAIPNVGAGGPMQALRAAIPNAGAAPAAGAAAVPKLDSFLQTANSFMNTAQKFTPYVQQAAPMIKNLPALWRMYRGFSNSPDDEEDFLESTTVRAPRESRNMRESVNFDDKVGFNNRNNNRRNSQKRDELTTKPSIPRIYQPPFDIF